VDIKAIDDRQKSATIHYTILAQNKSDLLNIQL